MRFFEIQGGVNVALSNEESELVDKITDSNGAAANTLSDRERQVSRRLVSKGALRRIEKDGKPYLIPNSLDEVWRD